MSNNIRTALQRLIELDDNSPSGPDTGYDPQWLNDWYKAIAKARDALAAQPVGEDENGCARIELVTAINCLASHFETACSGIGGDDLQKAKNDIAHARRIAANHNQNGPGCPQFPPTEALAARPLLEKVAQLADWGGAHSLGEIMAISSRAAAWLRDNPPGQPVAIEPRGCPTPGACSCVEPDPPAPTVVPVAVAERLPGEGDCDAEGRCWCFAYDGRVRGWTLRIIEPGVYDTHWLPHYAIPLPQGVGGECRS